MRYPLSNWLAILALTVLAFGCRDASAQRYSTLESQHYRIMHEKKHAQLAGEILEIAESVWPTLAKAYQSYEHFQRIDIVIMDRSDDANGFAIYPWSQVAIFAPHMDWVLRNRQVWLRNVVTHELAHVFSLRRAARLSPFDYVDFTGRTYSASDRVNFSFSVPWVPLIAPNWYVEGIAQFEAEQNGNDSYDSQRDMLLRDAWLTGTLPSLEYIETFDRAEDWIQGERVYNTGYAFLRYLKDRYGVEKVRKLAFSKPYFNFASAAEDAYGKTMPELFEEFKKSLSEKYADFKDLPIDPVADPDMPGSYQQNLAFSSDGRYMAWLGNDESRRFPANWIFWKHLKGNGEVKKSGSPTISVPAAPSQEGKEPNPSPDPKPEGLAAAARRWTSVPGMAMFQSPNPTLDIGKRYMRLMSSSENSPSPARMIQRNHHHGVDRSEELGSEGLQFNRSNDRLLTTRQDAEYSAYTDIWEYDFKANKSEKLKWRRLTWEERASYPTYHPTKDLIVFVRKKSGTTNLAVLDSTGRIGQLTNFNGGQQVFNPRYNPKGDSIYFTLQVEDKEAIAVIAADAAPFDPFLALRDSAAFPDSVNMARGQKLTFVTHPKSGAIRHIRFAGDTLYWSSNMLDTGASVYNVYARLPGDSAVLRATSARTQALEPLAHDGKLYYQGFQRQRFLLFQRPLAFAPTGKVLAPYVDTVTSFKPKKIDYTKAFETGEYGSRKIAHEIIPFMSLQPQFVENNRAYTDVAMGLALNLGDPMGNWTQSFTAAVSKRLDLRRPLTYQLSYAGTLSGDPIRHTRITFPMEVQYSLYHDILHYEDVYKERAGYRQGIDTIAVRARSAVTTVVGRDVINATLPLPYEFALDAGFFRQQVSQDMTQRVEFFDGSNGTLLETQDQTNISLLNDATQHRNFQLGLNWGHTWMRMGTYLPTGFAVWGSAKKWWANYQSGSALADSTFVFNVSHDGGVAPQYVLTESQFNPWSVDAGVGTVLSQGKHYSFFANFNAGSFLNKFPMEKGVADLGPDSLSEETANSLWVMTYQLGYSMMPGYPYNFRYRGRDIMEGTTFGRLQYGVDIPLRGLGFFVPYTPVSSFQQFTLTAQSNAGTAFILPTDRIYDAVDQGQYNLLMDFGVRLAATFNIYHQYPFTIYAQGFKPYNELSPSKLYWYDYPHTGAPNPDGTPSPEQVANAAKDRKEYMKLVEDPRFFVGFTLGY